MIIISNPNNPTGTIIEKRKLLQLIKGQNLIFPFVTDEVYYGYTQETLINYINKFKTIIYKTFFNLRFSSSKSWIYSIK